MTIQDKIRETQHLLKESNMGGWLLYDFRRTNDLAHRFLEIPSERMMTRRFFYWIPSEGEATKIVHRIESQVLDHLPGNLTTYSSWEELEQLLKKTLRGSHRVAMEYSPNNAIPYVSKVDGGTIDLVRSFGVEVVSSANILQRYTSIWTPEQLTMHLAAAGVLDATVAKAWDLIRDTIKSKKTITEYDVQRFILDQFEQSNCTCDDPPICAVNAHSADPHYIVEKSKASPIKPGDFVLIDLWCKQKKPHAVYADITRVGVVAPKPTEKQQKIFSIVRDARDAAMDLIRNRLQAGAPIMGWEVDQACRSVIEKAGYRKYFTHRTGHNIGERDHGDGANIDNLETKDCRFLLPQTCFSIEPGIYLPGEFGVRLEHDVYIEADGKNIKVTGGLQKEIECLQ